MLLGVLWRDQNGTDWNYNKISEHATGQNYEESKAVIFKSLHWVYSPTIIKNRPRDPSQNYVLNKGETYVIDPNIKRGTYSFSKTFLKTFVPTNLR